MSVRKSLCALSGLALLATSACDQDEPVVPNPACTQEALPLLPGDVTATVRGSVRIRDRRSYKLDSGGVGVETKTGSVQGSFADFSTYTSTPAALISLGDLCLGVTSRQVSSGSVRRLDLDRLTVDGTTRGMIDVTRTSTGTYASSGAELLLGSAALHLVGTSRGAFPPFDLSLPALPGLEVSRPAKDGEVKLDYEPLTVEWAPGDGDWIQLTVVPEMMQGQPATGGQALCYVQDDGCFEMPTEVNTFLLASQAPSFTFTLERHRYNAMMLANNAAVEVEATSEWQRTLSNGVLAQ